MKLRSKFTLLLLVGALLLAAPAMALMTDMGPNILPTSWTSQSDKANIDAPGANPGAKPGGNPSGNPSGNSGANTSPAIQGKQSDVADPSANTLPVQTIQSNKADNAPGATVALTGSNWQPGESIRIDVNDDQGKTWSRNVDVRADASGQIQVQFQLPEWLGGTYEVTAMGEQSGVATTSFTQGNVTFGGTSPAAAGTRVSLSGDPGGTKGNITGLNAHFESANQQAPMAQPQPIVNTEEDAAKTITLSATDEDADDLSFFIVTPPNHGTLGPIGALTCAGTAPKTCSANVTYTPDNDYNGFDIFSFKASDGTSDSYPAPVSILVDPLNGTPVATDDTKTMSEDGSPLSVDFGALASDVETSDANLTYNITTPDPAKGSLGGTGSTRTFTPAADFNGTVDIGYTVADRSDPDNCSAANPPCTAAKTSAQKSVTVTVDAVNDAPSFQKGSDQTVNEDAGTQTVDGWATAITAGPNESGQTVDFQLTNDNNNLFAPGGHPFVASNGTLTYTLAADENGSATVKIKAKDSGGTANGGQDESAEQTFTIAVGAVNDAPSFQKGADQTVDEDAGAQTLNGWTTDISAGPADENGQQLIFEVTNDNNLFTAGGQPAIDANGKLTYEAAPNANGSATVTVKARDDGGTLNGGADTSAEQTFTIDVRAVNDAPIARADTMATDEDTKLVFPSSDLVGNDDEGADNESSQTMTVTEVYEGTNGTGSLGMDGNITFTPEVDFSGDATFRYLVCDDGSPSKCSVQRAVVNVTAVNDPPVADDHSVTTDEDTAKEVTLSASDVEGDALGYTIVSATQHGTLSGTGANLTYTPEADYNGPDRFTFKAIDGTADSELATVSIAVSAINDAPVANDDTKSTNQDTPLVFPASQLLGNDNPGPANERGQTLMVTAVDQAFNGQVSLGTNGDITFTPATDFIGQASFEYTVCDNGSPSECSVMIAKVNVTMSPVNDAPMVSNLQGAGAANEGDVKTYTFDIADVDSSTFTASVDCGGTGKGKLVAGSLQMTATNGEFKCKFLDGLISPTPVNISVQASDGGKLSNVESKSVSVSNVAPLLPAVSSSSQNVLAGAVNTVTFTGTATDVSPIDLGAGFSWRWAIDGGAYGPFGAVNANTLGVGGTNNGLYFSTCGTHTVEAQVSDKDAGVSAKSPQAMQSVSVYNGAFSPPLVDGSTNLVQKGQVVPVEISIGCGTTNLTNLTPHIQLLSGNVSPETESGSTTVTTTSVLTADTTESMRQVDGGYIYNLQVPSNATANQEFTIRVDPFGATADHAATGMYVVIKISE